MKKAIQFAPLLMISVLLFQSCSSSKKVSDKKKQVVSRPEYDELLNKYNTLLAKSKLPNQLQANKLEESPDVERITLMDKLKGKQADELKETVDIFKKNTVTKKKDSLIEGDVDGNLYDIREVEADLKNLSKAYQHLKKNQFNASLKMLKLLEKSSVRQVRAYAKFYLGEILFKQTEYDLSMQVFQSILEKEAFSGVILVTLRRLIKCTEKLKLGKKRKQYFSILHDFFGEKSG